MANADGPDSKIRCDFISYNPLNNEIIIASEWRNHGRAISNIDVAKIYKKLKALRSRTMFTFALEISENLPNLIEEAAEGNTAVTVLRRPYGPDSIHMKLECLFVPPSYDNILILVSWNKLYYHDLRPFH